MIRIKIPNIDSVANKHYRNVAIKCGKKGFAKTLLEILEKKGKGKKTRKKEFFKQLKKDIELPFESSLITGKPSILKGFIDSYKTDFLDVLSVKKNLKELEKIFFYGKYEKWNAYGLSKDLNVKVCPYCNRQYTFILEKAKGKKGTRLEIPHK